MSTGRLESQALVATYARADDKQPPSAFRVDALQQLEQHAAFEPRAKTPPPVAKRRRHKTDDAFTTTGAGGAASAKAAQAAQRAYDQRAQEGPHSTTTRGLCVSYFKYLSCCTREPPDVETRDEKRAHYHLSLSLSLDVHQPTAQAARRSRSRSL